MYLSHPRPNLSKDLNAFQVEAAWKLGQWDKLETLLESVSSGQILAKVTWYVLIIML